MFWAKYGTATTFQFPMIKRGVVDFAQSADWTPSAADVAVSKDNGDLEDATNAPAIVGGSPTRGVSKFKWAATATELECAVLEVQIVDAATKAVEDQSFAVYTYGHASAFFKGDWSDIVRLGLVALPNAAYNAPGGLVGSAAGGLDLDTQLGKLVGTLAAGTHQPQTGDSYPIVSSGTHGNAAIKTDLDKIPKSDGTVAFNATAVGGIQSGLATALAVSALQTDLTTLVGRLTSARAGYLDNLNAGGVVASQADINALNQSASRRVILTTVQQYERPESGTSTFTIEMRTYDGDGAAVDADSTPSLAVVGNVSGDLSANLSAGTNPATGLYSWTYTVESTDAIEQLRFAVSPTIGGSQFPLSSFAQVVDFVAATWTTDDRVMLTGVFDKLPTNGIADQTLLAAAIGTPMQAGDYEAPDNAGIAAAETAALAAQTAAEAVPTAAENAAGIQTYYAANKGTASNFARAIMLGEEPIFTSTVTNAMTPSDQTFSIDDGNGAYNLLSLGDHPMRVTQASGFQLVTPGIIQSSASDGNGNILVSIYEAIGFTPAIGDRAEIFAKHVHSVDSIAIASQIRMDSSSAKLATAASGVTTLLTRITSTLFTGITTLLDHLLSTSRAAKFERTVGAMCTGTVGTGSTITSIVCSAIDPAGVDADQFKGRIIIFDDGTTTTALRGQGAPILGSTAAGLPVFTVTALTRAPVNGDTFTIN